MSKYVSGSCMGEICSICGKDATHKIGEEIFWDDPNKMRHNFTAYVCCEHFQLNFGPASKKYCIDNKHVQK